MRPKIDCVHICANCKRMISSRSFHPIFQLCIVHYKRELRIRNKFCVDVFDAVNPSVNSIAKQSTYTSAVLSSQSNTEATVSLQYQST